MDRGIATAEKIKWLIDNGYKYLVVNREQKRIFDAEKQPPSKSEAVEKS
jgi:hypothetical protein